jgi:hypothetical protein
MFVVIIRDKTAHLRVLQAPQVGDVVPLSSSLNQMRVLLHSRLD